MKNRNLVILVAVVAAVAAYILLFERHQPTTDEALEQADKVFPGIEEETVTGLEINGAEGAVVLERTDDEWRLVEPIAYAADEATVSSLLSAVLELKAARRLDADEVDPAAYGLDSPEKSLVMTTAEGAVHRLDVGDKTPLGDNRAVATGGPGVILCSSWFTSHLDKGVEQWRSRDVVELYVDDVASLQVATREDRIEAVRLDDTWRLLEPVADLADPEHLRSLVSELNGLEVVDFIGDGADLGPLELDVPEYRVTVLRTEGRDPITLAFGATRNQEGATQVVCRRDGADLFWVKESIRTRLAKAPVRWRAGTVIPFDTWRAERLAITAGDSTVVADRSAGLWRLEDAGEADFTAVQNRLTAISKLEAVEFDLVDPVTPELGAVEINFEAEQDAEPEVVVLRFFAPLVEGGKAMVTVSNRDTVMSLGADAVDEVLGDLEGFAGPAEDREPLDGAE